MLRSVPRRSTVAFVACLTMLAPTSIAFAAPTAPAAAASTHSFCKKKQTTAVFSVDGATYRFWTVVQLGSRAPDGRADVQFIFGLSDVKGSRRGEVVEYLQIGTAPKGQRTVQRYVPDKYLGHRVTGAELEFQNNFWRTYYRKRVRFIARIHGKTFRTVYRVAGVDGGSCYN